MIDVCLENIESQHSEKLKKHDELQKSILLERQEAFGKVFNEEMDEFKKSGHIPSKSKRKRKGNWIKISVL